jgi:hypothetical protein
MKTLCLDSKKHKATHGKGAICGLVHTFAHVAWWAPAVVARDRRGGWHMCIFTLLLV